MRSRGCPSSIAAGMRLRDDPKSHVEPVPIFAVTLLASVRAEREYPVKISEGKVFGLIDADQPHASLV